MTNETPIYLKLKSADAQKLGRNGGTITYMILTDADRQALFICITGNDSGGYFSNEIARFDGIEACLPADRTQPFVAKSLIKAFTSRSSNQPGFAAALLRAEGLTAPVDGKPHLHQIAGDWAAWKQAILALPGEAYDPPAKSPALSTNAESAMTRQELPEQLQEDDDFRRKGRKAKGGKRASEMTNALPQA